VDVGAVRRLWDSGDAAVAQAIARHYETLDIAITANCGSRPVEQGEGDSVVAAFERPSDAARRFIGRGTVKTELAHDVAKVDCDASRAREGSNAT
jgi:class 3 adenylate cyclase